MAQVYLVVGAGTTEFRTLAVFSSYDLAAQALPAIPGAEAIHVWAVDALPPDAGMDSAASRSRSRNARCNPIPLPFWSPNN